MAKVHVCNVLVLDNPASFMSKLEFEITFECIEDLPEDLVTHSFVKCQLIFNLTMVICSIFRYQQMEEIGRQDLRPHD